LISRPGWVPTAIMLAALTATACAAPGPTAPVPGDRLPRDRASTLPTTGHATPTPTASVTPGEREVITYVFPIEPASAASYGRVHHDYPATDIFAACGSEVVAVVDGVVEETSLVDTWDPGSDDPAVRGGLSITVVGDDGVRYYGSHLLDVVPSMTPGARVRSGEVIGHVGDTGNAAGTGCHLHFGISPPCGPGDWAVRRGVLPPWPYLDAWRAGEVTSPRTEVDDWRLGHPGQCGAA